MANTIANVLVGVATLGIRQPNDAKAEWDSVNHQAGSYSAKLTKTGSGNAGSTHLEVVPSGVTFASFNTNMAINDKYTFYYMHQLGITGNFTQIEFRFEDPDSDNGHVEITAVPFQTHAGLGIWTKYDENVDGPSKVGYYGENEVGTRMDDWSLATATTQSIKGIIDALTIDGDADNWVLTRVRYELYESSPARYACIDTIVINGSAYTVEPGGTAPGMSLSSPFTDIGYTEDGVMLEYTGDTADIEVEEETIPINRVLTKETIQVTCNMAESSLYNIDKAIAGSVLSGSILTIGDKVLKTMNLKIAGTNPAGFNREIFIPLATATGAVGMSYKKGEKTVVPVTFQALKPATGKACTIVDNVA